MVAEFFKIVYDATFIVQLLAVSFALVWVFYGWKKNRKSILIGIGHVVAIFAVATVLNMLLFMLSLVWRGTAGIHFQIAWLLTVALYVCIFERKYMTNRIITAATIFAVAIVMADLGRELMRTLTPYMSLSATTFVCYIADLFIIGFAFVIRKYSLKYYRDIPLVSAVLVMINMCVITVSIVVYTIIRVNTGRFNVDVFYIVILVGMFIIAVTSYVTVYVHAKSHNRLTTLAVENKLLEADKQTLAVSEQAVGEMREFRHDIKNQYGIMRMMLDEKRYDELDEYLAEVTGNVDRSAMSTFIDCGNSIINSVINMEQLKAASNGVQFTTKINVPPTLEIKKSDLVRILVNLIDNAIEGCVRAKRPDNFVDVRISKVRASLYIGVTNKVADGVDVAKLLRTNTAKEDAANHGYGRKIVKRIAEKYNGYANYSVENGEFASEIMLDLSPETVGGGGATK